MSPGRLAALLGLISLVVYVLFSGFSSKKTEVCASCPTCRSSPPPSTCPACPVCPTAHTAKESDAPSPPASQSDAVSLQYFRPLRLKKVPLSIDGKTYQMFVYDPGYLEDVVSLDVIKNKKAYCPDQLTDLLRKCLAKFKEKCVFADVGANIGSCAFVAAAMGIKRVIAFEAVKENAYVMHQTMEENGFLDQVSIYAFAASDEEKDVIVNRLHGNAGHNMVGAKQDRKELDYYQEMTRTVRLDKVVKEHVHVMKIDVEGHERLVFRGATGLVKDFGVDVMFFEYAPWILTEMWKKLENQKKVFDAIRGLNMRVGEDYDFENGKLLKELSPEKEKKMTSHTRANGFALYDFYVAK